MCERRITEVEKAFSLLVFAWNVGAGPSASKALKQLASKISVQKEDNCAYIVSYLRTKISFAHLRSSLLCIRGSKRLGGAKYLMLR